MLQTTWKRVLDSWGRLTLTAATVMLGVLFLVAALVLSDSTRTALRDSYAQAYAGADVIVRAPEGFSGGPQQPLAALPSAVVERLATVPGAADAEGRIRELAQVITTDGDTGDAVAIAAPTGPGAAAIQLRTGTWPARSDEVAIDAALATTLGIQVGDGIELLVPAGVIGVRIVGTVGFGRLDGLAGGGRVVLHRETAVDLLAADGFGEVAVTAEPGTTPAQLADRISSELGHDVSVLTASAAADRDATAAARQTAVISYILGGVALIGLLIGSFLIANTLRMLVAQRSRELALLRAVGATRRQVAASVLLEAALTGLVGAAAGTALGLGAGAVLASTSGGLVPGLPPTSATITATPLLVGPVVGIVVAVLASRTAVRRALGVAPVAAMRQLATDDRRPGRARLLSSVVALVLGTTLVVIGGSLGVMAVAAGGALAVVGVGGLFPFVTGLVLAMLSRPISRFGATAKLARQQLLTAPARTGATAAALAVALALITFLLTFSASMGAATPAVVASRERAELTIRSDAPWGLHGFMPDLAGEVGDLPGVALARSVAYGSFAVTAGDGPARESPFYATDPAAVPHLFHVEPTDGDLDGLTPGQVAVRDEIAQGSGLDVGDPVTATLPDGETVEFIIGATFSGSITTNWILGPDTAAPYLDATGQEIFVRLAEGTDLGEVRPAIEAVADRYPATQVLDRAEKEAGMADANASTLGILTALLSLAVIVGVLGVVNTLSLAVTERIRELGLLRAVGATQRQVRTVVRWEAALIAGLATVLGTAIGVGLAWIATSAFTEFEMPLVIPVPALAGAAAATMGLGVMAAILPARKASRIDVLRALQTT